MDEAGEVQCKSLLACVEWLRSGELAARIRKLGPSILRCVHPLRRDRDVASNQIANGFRRLKLQVRRSRGVIESLILHASLWTRPASCISAKRERSSSTRQREQTRNLSRFPLAIALQQRLMVHAGHPH
jgi:hypothetical protein